MKFILKTVGNIFVSFWSKDLGMNLKGNWNCAERWSAEPQEVRLACHFHKRGRENLRAMSKVVFIFV